MGTSNLVGKAPDGTLIREFEASHGTVADLYDMHLRGEETSLNPLGMAEALMGAINHSADLSEDASSRQALHNYTAALRKALHNTFRYGQGTKDLSGPSGLSTEAFVSKVGNRLQKYLKFLNDEEAIPDRVLTPSRQSDRAAAVDEVAVKKMFDEYDLDDSGSIDFEEFLIMVTTLGVAPKIRPTIPKNDVADVAQ